jgi:hypothetical protein
MTVAMRSIFGLAVVLWLTQPGASLAADAEVPWQNVAANLKVHKVIASIDQDSFDAAIARYPQSETGGSYPVKAGRYLMWKIVGLFTSNQRVEQIRLESFVMPCRTAKSGFDTQVTCDLNASILVRSGGQTRIVDISIDRTVGRFFDPAKPDYATVIAAEIKDPIDQAVARIQVELKAAGFL